MRTLEQYKNWVFPYFLKNPEWNFYVETVIGEILDLQKYNMGSYNSQDGFSGVLEDIKDFTEEGNWAIANVFEPYKSYWVESGEGFSLDIVSNKVEFVGDLVNDCYLIQGYSFVKGKSYRIKFTISDIFLYMSIFQLRIYYGIGNVEQNVLIIDSDTIDPVEVDTIVTAEDYYFTFLVKVLHSKGELKISNFEVVGVEDEENDENRMLLINKIIDRDEANRYILERMYQSTDFPQVANLPIELIRQILTYQTDFISYFGSEIGTLIFFYFFGYSVRVIELYAHKDDYEARVYGYIQQKESDVFNSELVGDLKGTVNHSQFDVSVIEMNLGHTLKIGDIIFNETNPFNLYSGRTATRLIVAVDENNIYVNENCEVEIDDEIKKLTSRVYAEVVLSKTLVYNFQCKIGHQIVEGDLIYNNSRVWGIGYVRVLKVEGQNIYVEQAVTVYSGDLISIEREYSYAVNPDPENYFKSSHIDIYFSKNNNWNTNISFSFLEQYLSNYLPGNVVIRFFGYATRVPSDSFSMLQSSFGFAYRSSSDFYIEEEVVYPPDDETYVVADDIPVNDKDIFDEDCDGYSYVYLESEEGYPFNPSIDEYIII